MVAKALELLHCIAFYFRAPFAAPRWGRVDGAWGDAPLCFCSRAPRTLVSVVTPMTSWPHDQETCNIARQEPTAYTTSQRLAERRIHRLNIHAYARDSRRVVTGSPTHDHCMGQQFFFPVGRRVPVSTRNLTGFGIEKRKQNVSDCKTIHTER